MSEIPSSGLGAGAMLRAAREKQGLHIAALAAAIKVSPRKLDALEHDRWHELPDATFTRALAQTVCRTLKVDARPVLDKLPPASATGLEPRENVLNEPFRERPGREEPGFAVSAVRPMVWGAAVLMVAAVVVSLLPADLWSRLTSAGSSPGTSAAPAGVVTPAVTPLAVPALEPASAAAAAADAAASAPAVAVPAVPDPAASSATPAGAPAPAATTPFAAPTTTVAIAAAAGLVQLRTSQASWIEARDARGATLLSRTVLPGENVDLDGKLPIRMTIGNASATQLAFRGSAIDLTPRTRDNIARVELQ